MPTLILPVPESEQSITRPIVRNIVDTVAKITGLPKDVSISYPGSNQRTFHPGSTLSDKTDNETLPSNTKFFIEVDEEYLEDMMPSTYTYRPEHLPIWQNEDLRVLIKPVYIQSQMRVSFKFRSADKTTAIRWRDSIRARVSMREDIRVLDLTYHYSIPDEYDYILKEIHRLQEAVEGYGETFDEFYQRHLDTRATIVTDPAGKNTSWVIPENQTRVLGHFDFDIMPEKGGREDNLDTWTISFDYIVRFDKPISCVMRYPIMIHNQVLSSDYRDSKPYQTMEDRLQVRSASLNSIHPFESKSQLGDYYGKHPGKQIPAFDDWMPRSAWQPTMRIFTALTSVDPDDKRSLMSISELEESYITLDRQLKNFMVSETPYMSAPFDSIFCLSLYKGVEMQEWGHLVINKELEISSTRDLSLRQFHHLRLAFITDISLLTPGAKDRLKEWGPVLVKIIDYLLPPGVPRPPIRILNPDWETGKGYVPGRDFDDLIDFMKDYVYAQPGSGFYSPGKGSNNTGNAKNKNARYTNSVMHTVQTSLIRVKEHGANN